VDGGGGGKSRECGKRRGEWGGGGNDCVKVENRMGEGEGEAEVGKGSKKWERGES